MKKGNKQPYCIESKPVFGRRGRADPPEEKKPQKVEQKPQKQTHCSHSVHSMGGDFWKA